MKDFYAILGTDINCTPSEIREAYRKLSKKFHPGLNGNDSYFESRFREIREAYETLSDTARRSQYDAALKKSASATVVKQSSSRTTTALNIAFTVTLLVITTIFGTYVYRSLNGGKAAKISQTAMVTTAPVHTLKHHKRRHSLKSVPGAAKIISPPVQIVKVPVVPPPTVKAAVTPPQMVKAVVKPAKTAADTVANPIKKAAPIVNQVAYKVPADNTPKPINKPQPVTNNVMSYAKAPVTTTAPVDASYTSYIKANVTGVVYMKRLDDYRSDMVKVVPNNAKVLVLQKGNTFYKVQYDNQVGFVPKWTVVSK
jgi:hypothetical protein